MSKRKNTQERTEILLGVAFFVAAGLTAWQTDTGGTMMALYASLCGALGYSASKYHSSEGERPSGTIPDDTVSTGMYETVEDER